MNNTTLCYMLMALGFGDCSLNIQTRRYFSTTKCTNLLIIFYIYEWVQIWDGRADIDACYWKAQYEICKVC
jgi:hypothetical protein